MMRLKAIILSRASRAMKRQWFSNVGRSLVQLERWLVVILLFVGAGGLYVVAALADSGSGEPSWKDFVGPISGSLFGLAVARPLDLQNFRRGDIWWLLIWGLVMCGSGICIWLGLAFVKTMWSGPFLASVGASLAGASLLKLLPKPVHIRTRQSPLITLVRMSNPNDQ